MTTFTVNEAFPLDQVNLSDQRFMSRLDRDAWEAQVQALMVEIAQQGPLAPVGIARPAGEQRYVVVYGFTRTAAVARLADHSRQRLWGSRGNRCPPAECGR